jgi:parallel beta-helix repeat protein
VRPILSRALPFAGIAFLAAPLLPASASGAPATVAGSACTRYASPSGNDAAAGTKEAPYKTAQRLVGSLASGQVGCLRAGTYAQDVTISRAGVTLTAYAGEHATIIGRVWVKAGADGVVISGLSLDGKNAQALPSPTVNANNVQIVDNDISNENTEICLLIGSDWGRARHTLVQRNRIHNCGKLPSQNEDHGIYVSEADDTQIVDNAIYDNADRGIQLYPDAQRTVIRDNIIDGNGEGIIFSGDDGLAASGTLVEHNVIADSTIRANVESWYPVGNPVGSGNLVRDNCIGRAATKSAIGSAGIGFTATSNVSTNDVGFVDRGDDDFRLSPSSACLATLSTSVAPANSAWSAPVGNGGEQSSGNNPGDRPPGDTTPSETGEGDTPPSDPAAGTGDSGQTQNGSGEVDDAPPSGTPGTGDDQSQTGAPESGDDTPPSGENSSGDTPPVVATPPTPPATGGQSDPPPIVTIPPTTPPTVGSGHDAPSPPRDGGKPLHHARTRRCAVSKRTHRMTCTTSGALSKTGSTNGKRSSRKSASYKGSSRKALRSQTSSRRYALRNKVAARRR